MPLYEYQCPACGKCFEELRRAGDETPPPCPACGNEDTQKQISAACVRSSVGTAASACAPSGNFS